jgi:hypothetical protein
MRVLDRGRLQQSRKKRVARALANGLTMRDHAAMARTQLRTKDYPDDARKRLGKEVERARSAAGFRYRTDFCRAHGIKNLRGLEMLEGGRPGVGQAFLFEVARALPNWTEETPRLILEGADPPPTNGPPSAPEPAPTASGLSDAERSLIRTLRRRRWHGEDIAEALDELRRSSAVLPTVEPPSETDRERNAIPFGQSGETGT